MSEVVTKKLTGVPQLAGSGGQSAPGARFGARQGMFGEDGSGRHDHPGICFCHVSHCMYPEACSLRDEETRALDERLNGRRQWVENCVQGKLRNGIAISRKAPKNRKAHIDWLEKRITHIDDGLKWNLRASAARQAKKNLSYGIPEMDRAPSLTPLLKCPELGRLGRRQTVARVSVVSLTNDSDKPCGKRSIRDDRADLRAAQ
jgi:hypothetical protein